MQREPAWGDWKHGKCCVQGREGGAVENGILRCYSLGISRAGGGKDGGMLAWQIDVRECEWAGWGLEKRRCHAIRDASFFSWAAVYSIHISIAKS